MIHEFTRNHTKDRNISRETRAIRRMPDLTWGSGMIAAAKNKCASSEVAIAGDALRRPSWHWQAVSMSTSDGSCNRLTLGSAPTRPENYTLVQISVNEFVCPEAINFSSSQDRTSISRKTATLRAFDRLWRGSYT